MREAMIDGQLCDWSEAPVPMVYESPSARYRIASSILPIPLRARRARLPASGEDTFLSLYIGQRAPDVYFGFDPADDLCREVGSRGLATKVGGPHPVGDGLQRCFVDRPRGPVRRVACHVTEERGHGHDHRHRVGDGLAL